MAVVRMNKFTILTFECFKEQLLKQLQIFEGVHFKNLQESEEEKLEFLRKDSSREALVLTEAEANKIRFVLDKVNPFVEKQKGFKALTTFPEEVSFEEFENFTKRYDYNSIYEQIKKLDEQIKSIRAERNKLRADCENLKNWIKLDVCTKDLDSFKQVSYFLGVVTKTDPNVLKEAIEKSFDSFYFEVIETIKDESMILLVINNDKQEEASTLLKSMNFTKASVNLSEIAKKQIQENELKILSLTTAEEKANEEIKKYVNHKKNMEICLDYFKTCLERQKACDNFLALENVVVIEGWVSKDDSKKVEEILKKCCNNDYYIENEEVKPDCNEVPIKLKNGKIVSAFESVTSMYALPKYNELDPTPLLAPFYIVFFGLMVGDLGFGLVLLIVSAIAGKLNVGAGVKNFMRFLFVLSFSVMGAGLLYASFFGFPIEFMKIIPIEVDGQIVKKAVLDTGFDIQAMLLYSVVLGIVHVLFGVLIKGYALVREGKILDAIFDSLFWFLCVLSGIVFMVGATGFIPASVGNIGKWIFILSIIGLTLTQGRENKTIATKLAGGLFGVYGLTSYVGDIVSYTRIIALALSGAYIGMSFNMMGGLLFGKPVTIIFGVIVIIFGQLLNLGLGVLGAYVHTCRLQYVEYFGKFYEGGGKPFKPFKLLVKSIKIK